MVRVRVLKPLLCSDDDTGKAHVLPVGMTFYYDDIAEVEDMIKLGYVERAKQPTDITAERPRMKKLPRQKADYQQSFAWN